MSVVLGFLSPTCVTLACDGRTSWRQPDGSLKPSREHYKKIAMLGGKAACGMTGSSVLQDVLVPELDAAAREMPFDELVAFTAKTAKARLLELSRAYIIEGLAIFLAGIVEGKPRMVYIGSQDNFVPDEIVNPAGKCGVCSLGGDASEPIRDKAFELLCAGICPLPQNAGQFCETVIQGMSRQFAHTINANTWSITLSPGMNYETHRPIPAEPEVLVGTEADGLNFGRTKQTVLDGSGNVMKLGNSTGDFLKFDGTGTGSIYNSSGTLVAAATKRHVPTVPFSQTNAANANDGETVFFNSGSGTPFLQDINGNAFPVFANAPGVVLQAQNPPAGLASFYAVNITPTSFKVVSKGSGALTNYGITLSDRGGLINVTGGTNTSLDTLTDAFNTNVTQASGVTTQVQFSVSVSTILSETSGQPDFGGIYNFVCQVWSGNMGVKLAEGSFNVTVRSTGATFSNGATLAALSIAASSQFTVRIYQASNSDTGAATGTTASATGGYTAAPSINGVDFTALIIEPWA